MHHARHIRGGIARSCMAFNAIAVQINKDQLFGNVLIQQGVSRRAPTLPVPMIITLRALVFISLPLSTITRERKLPPQAHLRNPDRDI
jgi:hypothetical protein